MTIWGAYINLSLPTAEDVTAYSGAVVILFLIIACAIYLFQQHNIGMEVAKSLKEPPRKPPQEKTKVHLIAADLESFWQTQMGEKDVILTVFSSPDIPMVLNTNPILVHQIINSLIARAHHHTDHGRIHIHITYEHADSENPYLKIIGADTSNGDISIVKTGSISDFEMFNVKTLKQYTDRLRAHFEYKARPGRGAEFVFSIPAKDITESVMGPAADDPPAEISEQKYDMPKKTLLEMGQKSTRETIAINAAPQSEPIDTHADTLKGIDNAIRSLDALIVEDQSSNRDAIRALLAPLNHKIIYAQDGRDALERMQAHIFDYIIMDIHMPGMNGIEAAQIIRDQETELFHIPIIALTADTTIQTAHEALSAGMDMVLTKPVTSVALFEAIRTAIASQSEYQAFKASSPLRGVSRG